MLMKNSNRCLKFILLLLPAAIGMLGLLIDRSVSFGDAVYRCVTMYVINYTESPPNVLVDLARWLAPIATTSGILLAVSSVNARVRAWLVSRRADSFAVYGETGQQDVLLDQLGDRGTSARGTISLPERSRTISRSTPATARSCRTGRCICAAPPNRRSRRPAPT